jgi:hypothetical protein
VGGIDDERLLQMLERAVDIVLPRQPIAQK